MSKIKDKIDLIIEEFSKEVNQAILDRNFKRISIDEHTIAIEVLGENVDIWNVEDQEVTLWRIQLGFAESLLSKGREFKKPKTCRKILNECSEEEIVEHNLYIQKEIEKLQAKTIKEK